MATPLLSTEMIHSLRVMSGVSAENRGPAEIVARQGAWLQWRWVLGRETEHEAGIEWVTVL